MCDCLYLKCPRSDMCEYSTEDVYGINNLQDFVTVLSTAANSVTSDSSVWKEIETFCDIQERYKKMLCCHKSLAFLQRIGHCLKQMVLLNLSKSCLDLAEQFLYGFQDRSTSLHLPSRQQVEYILFRTKIAAKLVSEAIIYSQDTFCFLVQKLKVKHLVPELMLTTCATARFNMMLKATLKQLCTMYKEILSWRSKFKKGTFKWPEKIDLPQDLEKWLETFDSKLMKSFRMSQADFNIISSTLNVRIGKEDSDLDCVIIMDGRDKNNSVSSSSSSKKRKMKQKKNSSRNLKSLNNNFKLRKVGKQMKKNAQKKKRNRKGNVKKR